VGNHPIKQLKNMKYIKVTFSRVYEIPYEDAYNEALLYDCEFVDGGHPAPVSICINAKEMAQRMFEEEVGLYDFEDFFGISSEIIEEKE
jgi:hypothetical protein